MSQEDDNCGQMDETLKVFGMIFITHHQPPEVEEPGKEPLHLPAAAVTPQRSAILRGHAPVDFVGRNQFNAVVGAESFIQPVTIVSLVADQAVGVSGTKRSAKVGSTNFTSAGEALSVRKARGRP